MGVNFDYAVARIKELKTVCAAIDAALTSIGGGVTTTSTSTLTNKTLSDSTTIIGAVGALTKKLKIALAGATAGKTMTLTSSHTDDRAVTLPDATDTLVGKATADTLTNKTLSDSTTIIGAVGALTKAVKFSNAGATADKTATLTFAHTDNRAITFPDATDTLVGKATTDVLTNKTIDADGTGNVITNINADELDSVALGTTAVTGVPFSIIATISNLAEAGANLIQNSTTKFIITGAELINTSAPDAGATWQLCQGSVGAIGTAITEAVAADNADKIKTVALSFNDAVYTVASGASGDLCVIGDASGTLDGVLVVHCIRID